MKLVVVLFAGDFGRSRPARGAWIETAKAKARPLVWIVAPRAGRVD